MKNKYVLIFAVIITAGILSVFANPLCAAEKVGEVSSASARAFAVRDGSEAPLSVKSEIYKNDVLKTDAKGRLEVKFLDGTVVALGPSSEARVAEFIMSETKNNFSAGVAKGAARVITGDIVKRNPNGFQITTPRTTVGIRGTDVLFAISENGNELFTINHIDSGNYVNIVDRLDASSHKMLSSNRTLLAPNGAQAIVVKDDARLQSVIDNLLNSVAGDAPLLTEQQPRIELDEMMKTLDEIIVEITEQNRRETDVQDEGTLSPSPVGPPSPSDKKNIDPGTNAPDTSEPKPREIC